MRDWVLENGHEILDLFMQDHEVKKAKNIIH
jgi:hypothetical protein